MYVACTCFMRQTHLLDLLCVVKAGVVEQLLSASCAGLPKNDNILGTQMYTLICNDVFMHVLVLHHCAQLPFWACAVTRASDLKYLFSRFLGFFMDFWMGKRLCMVVRDCITISEFWGL